MRTQKAPRMAPRNHIPDCSCPICRQVRKLQGHLEEGELPLVPRGSPTVSVAMTVEEKAHLERMATEANLSQSAYIRRLLLRARRRKSGQQ